MTLKKNNSLFNIFISVVVVALPTMLEQILSVLMQYVDTAMVGRLGANATAAVSTSTTITWLVGSIPVAFGVGAMTQIAQAIGSGEHHKISQVAKASLVFAIGVGAVVEIICLAACPFVASWMGASAEVAPAATRYFFWISVPIIFKSLNIILSAAIRATKDTKTPMYIGVGANILNVVLDYLLIYTFNLGVDGAAYATCISAIFSGVMTLMVFLRHKEFKMEGPILSIEREIISRMWRLSLPVLLINVASTSGYVVFAGLVSHMGTIIFAAHSIAVGAEELFYIGGYGFKSAANTMVGISYGEQNHDKYHAVCVSSILATVLIMTLSGVLLYVFATPLMGFFTNDSDVIALGSKVLKMVAFNEPFFGLYIISEGIYYGLGRTKYPFVVEFGGMWLVRILSTYIGIHYFGFGLVGVWCCMIADNVLKAIMLAVPVRWLWKK
ncbi:putative efflux protein, MATE family [Pseudobutyrivibrio sp. 49]|uniref:MATE family efflux transporter n=1 Tax=unclassified Pseudobutyrivibrio TaxID=2638619 RepID=UPI000890C29F|nr:MULTISPECIES: MATE family efflux transporter [unclassified Pseudobutyrivibrio]SDI53394.1 putative efflux protein, MATE family [Pseudobutyrivibrio sp. 49]SFN92770.1 putative efflux protein, MATE family [Pseudobutyrivibrio sp. UC1225]